MIEKIQNNYIDLWQKLAVKDPRWQIIYHNNIISLRSPGVLNDFNISWNIETRDDYLYAQKIYHKQYFYFLNRIQGYLDDSIRRGEELEYMCRDIKNADEILLDLPTSNSIDIKPVMTYGDACIYASFMDDYCKKWQHEIAETILIITKYAKYYLAYFEDKPVGKACGHVDKYGNLLISSVSVTEQARRQGIGRALVIKCMENGCVDGAKKAILIASQKGKSVYEKLGFTSSGNVYYVGVPKTSHIK